MGLTTAYLVSTKNLNSILAALQNAQAPQRFTTRFLASLGYKSPNDRLIIGVLKGLGFLDDSGAPTEQYFKFLDTTEAKRILVGGIRIAYEDLFRININANELPQADVKNKLKTLTQGGKSETVLRLMAATFASLCELADFSKVPEARPEPSQDKSERQDSIPTEDKMGAEPRATFDNLCYRIELILPSTRDPAVYDALFRSLKEHLLK